MGIEFTDEQKRFYRAKLIPQTNLLRDIEEDVVSHASYRLIEVKLQCFHDMLYEMFRHTGIELPFDDPDVIRPSVYGENGGK